LRIPEGESLLVRWEYAVSMFSEFRLFVIMIPDRFQVNKNHGLGVLITSSLSIIIAIFFVAF